MASNRITSITEDNFRSVIERNDKTNTELGEQLQEYVINPDGGNYWTQRYLTEHPATILRNRAYNNILNQTLNVQADRNCDLSTAVSIVFFSTVRSIASNLRKWDVDTADQQAYLAKVDFMADVVDSRVWTPEDGYFDAVKVSALYSKQVMKERKAAAALEAKKQAEHEKMYGAVFNPRTEKVLAWQGVRKALKDAGYEIVKKQEVEGISVTSSKSDGIQVHINRPIKVKVAWTDEELTSKGYFLIDDIWHRKTYWSEQDIVREYDLYHWVSDEDKVANLLDEAVELKEVLRNAGYVVHDSQFNNYANSGEYIVRVTGWKVR